MTGELIATGDTFDVGRIAINNAFSGTAEFNNVALDSGGNFSAGTGGGVITSGGTDLYGIFAASSSAGLTGALAVNNETGPNDIIVSSSQVLSGAGTSNILNFNDGGALMLDTASGAYQSGVWADGIYAALYGNNWGPAFDVSKDGINDIDVLRMYTSAGGPVIAIAGDARAINIGGIVGLQITNTTSAQGLSSGFYSAPVSGLTSILTSIESTVSSGSRNSSIIGGSGHTINSSLQNIVIVGGFNITADTSNTLYAQNARLGENGGIIYSGGTDIGTLFGVGGSSDNIATADLVFTTGRTHQLSTYNLSFSGGAIDVKGGLTVDTLTIGTGATRNKSVYDFGTNSGATAWDIDVSSNSKITLNGDMTLNISNVESGDFGTMEITQDGVGSHTITLGTGTHRVANGGGGAITLTSSPSAVDVITFFYNGSEFNWSVGNDYT